MCQNFFTSSWETFFSPHRRYTKNEKTITLFKLSRWIIIIQALSLNWIKVCGNSLSHKVFQTRNEINFVARVFFFLQWKGFFWQFSNIRIQLFIEIFTTDVREWQCLQINSSFLLLCLTSPEEKQTEVCFVSRLKQFVLHLSKLVFYALSTSRSCKHVFKNFSVLNLNPTKIKLFFSVLDISF